ncbi:hypothetical protein DFH28DRAFT_1078018 [Melampsora americana]|nr:hypothetical protein DFH28DRAFT_1078018 [Melampsora americana]
MDGNFQHRHNKLASKDHPNESQYPSIFVRPSQIAKHDVGNHAPPPRANNPDDDDPCGEAHKTANDIRNSSTWDQCDDTGLFALACRHDVPLLMANIYKSGEKMYYPLSLIQSLLDDFPDLRVAILYDIGCHLDKHIKKHNKIPEYQRRIVLGTSVFHAYVHSWGCQLQYNPRFLEYWGLSDGEGLERLCGSQKDDTTSPHLKTSRFAKNLSLEGYYVLRIGCIRFDTQRELVAFNRLARFQDLATQIAEQRNKVGIPETLTHLSQAGVDSFLKVWFAKTEVRTRFLALRAEQWPLDPENKVGGSSRLGQSESLSIARTRTMKRTLTNYNRLACVFQDQHPDHLASPEIEYSHLIRMEADDPFWNDARFQRCKEEIRRLGWEVRRAMRWATQAHDRVWDILNHLKVLDINQPNELIQNFLSNEALGSLSIDGKVDVAKGLVHNTFAKISTLSICWDVKAMAVMMKTPPQLGDLELMTLWKLQLYRIKHLRAAGFGSTRHGDFENLFPPGRANEIANQLQEESPQDQRLDSDEEDWESGIERLWENRIDEGMLIHMMANVGLEREEERAHVPVQVPTPIEAF